MKTSLFTLFVVLSCADAEDTHEQDAPTRIFVENIYRTVATGNVMQELMGIPENERRLDDDQRIRRHQEISKLTANEKARLMLLYLLFYDFDGENAETLGDPLGDDRKEVGAILSEIDDKDFKTSCRNLRIPEDRVRMFRRLVTRWKEGS